jgi:hypothetical protein
MGKLFKNPFARHARKKCKTKDQCNEHFSALPLVYLKLKSYLFSVDSPRLFAACYSPENAFKILRLSIISPNIRLTKNRVGALNRSNV